ncbi:Phosphoglycerol transferase MdoB [Paenibacillus sp. UNCCL117]|uniref:LTA synthase family protein n=1 Tax=unclassified Paenibacillus TaxID=185978 RepID=UPI0008905E33|nr:MULTISPECIES: LTA synthase family protein [unclassified Paenibacillus]SDC65314.1 Phosphoglycerol transferase MdoB [Paenibacillus sp. cl123]SFW22741.1 Phosphoglycerol transferase MdoB [Paenibacillus sp. UNCCL117]
MGELQLALRTYGRRTATRLPLLLWAVWIVVLVEVLSRGQWGESLGWTFTAIPVLGLNALVVLGLLLLLTAITASVRISFWLVSSVCLGFGLVSGVKLSILGVPFLPWDLLLTSETQDMTQYISGIFNFTIISGFIAFVVISIVLLYKLPRLVLRLGWKHRITMGLVSALLLVAIYNDGAVNLKRLVNVQNIAWDQTENVRTNGFLLTTMMNIKYLFLSEPGGYDEKSIRALASSAPPAVTQAADVKPNIIVVLSESFWDPTQIKGLSFSRDPIPFYHELASKYSSGTMLSPQYGGGTANVEFEVLTGNSMRFLPQGSTPYNQYIDKGIDSLASILARQGYTSTAINPFHSWFYNSKSVYQNFGFSKYISQEFFVPDYEGPYLADRGVAKEIIQASEASSGTDFIFANTMENHYHYYPGKFKENTIEVTGVTGEAKGMFETLAQGLTGADNMLKSLVTHYEQSKEPTIIVFFGDHLPSLGDDYQAYKDSGYLLPDDPDFLNKIHRVPVLVWNNYLPEHQDKLDMSPSFLGPYALKLAGLEGSYYTDYLNQLAQTTPVIPPKNMYAQLGISEESLSGYEKLQYDILFGKQYAYKDRQLAIKDPNYVIGPGRLEVDHVKLAEVGSDRVITVEGRNLPAQGIVQINGTPVQTERNAYGQLTATVKQETLGQLPCKVEVIVKDSKDKIVVRSNTYAYDQPASIAADASVQ